jgi:hypothetical protein
MKLSLLLLASLLWWGIAATTAHAQTPAQAEQQAWQNQRGYSIRLSFFGGPSIRTILGNSDVAANIGLRAGVQVLENIYFGGRISLHPYAFGSAGANEPSGGSPIVIGAETGYEFRLSPTMFLRPYLGLGYYGIEGTYRGYGNVRYTEEYPSYVSMFGAIYSIEVAPNLLIGIEASLVWRANVYLNIHVGYRL